MQSSFRYNRIHYCPVFTKGDKHSEEERQKFVSFFIREVVPNLGVLGDFYTNYVMQHTEELLKPNKGKNTLAILQSLDMCIERFMTLRIWNLTYSLDTLDALFYVILRW
jgi:hypothetical protein